MNNSKKDQDFRNYIDYPYNNARGKKVVRSRGRNAAGYNMCCGLAATGDGTEVTAEVAPAPVAVAPKVQNMKTWQYAKTALALVGLYAIGMYLYKKYKK